MGIFGENFKFFNLKNVKQIFFSFVFPAVIIGQNLNEKLCEVRAVFEQYNLISGLHTFFAQNDANYENILPPLRILNENEKNNLLNQLYTLDFKNN